ncbi:MAG: hypothetical protein IPJ30_14425 [Acidobacteria bacterium]|nr:hypothetical protein [Acidobacteriota bacterium]
MASKFALFKSLPFGLAVGVISLSVVRRIFGIPVAFSHSQGAEDLIASHILGNEFNALMDGTYVDVGCNAPVRYSNTFEYYTRGWRVIIMDANA